MKLIEIFKQKTKADGSVNIEKIIDGKSKLSVEHIFNMGYDEYGICHKFFYDRHGANRIGLGICKLLTFKDKYDMSNIFDSSIDNIVLTSDTFMKDKKKYHRDFFIFNKEDTKKFNDRLAFESDMIMSLDDLLQGISDGSFNSVHEDEVSRYVLDGKESFVIYEFDNIRLVDVKKSDVETEYVLYPAFLNLVLALHGGIAKFEAPESISIDDYATRHVDPDIEIVLQ